MGSFNKPSATEIPWRIDSATPRRSTISLRNLAYVTMNAAKIAAAKVKCADGGHDDQFQQRLTDRDSRGSSAMFAAIRGLDICICVVGPLFCKTGAAGKRRAVTVENPRFYELNAPRAHINSAHDQARKDRGAPENDCGSRLHCRRGRDRAPPCGQASGRTCSD